MKTEEIIEDLERELLICDNANLAGAAGRLIERHKAIIDKRDTLLELHGNLVNEKQRVDERLSNAEAANKLFSAEIERLKKKINNLRSFLDHAKELDLEKEE